jgi:hypothetical protein
VHSGDSVTNEEADRVTQVIRALEHDVAAFTETLSERHRTTTVNVLRDRLEAYNNRVRHIVEQNRQRAAEERALIQEEYRRFKAECPSCSVRESTVLVRTRVFLRHGFKPSEKRVRSEIKRSLQ